MYTSLLPSEWRGMFLPQTALFHTGCGSQEGFIFINITENRQQPRIKELTSYFNVDGMVYFQPFLKTLLKVHSG